MTIYRNPFSQNNPDHAELWKMLVQRDIDAFITRDWNQIVGDFISDKFLGINANFSVNPSKWSLSFPRLEHYKEVWLSQAEESSKKQYIEPLKTLLYRASELINIEITHDKAAVRKKIEGVFRTIEGEEDILCWQTLYLCEQIDNTWKTVGFVGYLPIEEGMI